LSACGHTGTVTHAQAPPVAPVSIINQTDGINHSRSTTVAMYCRKDAADPSGNTCVGTLTLSIANIKIGSAQFNILSKSTGKVPVKVSLKGLQMVKKGPGRKRKTLVTVTMVDGSSLTKTITLKA
jgi:hypothetical protein